MCSKCYVIFPSFLFFPLLSLFSAYFLYLSHSNIISIGQTRAKNSRHQMAPASAVKVTTTETKAGKAVCEAVADEGLEKEGTWINNANCEIRR